MPPSGEFPNGAESRLARIDERTLAMEKRLARLELAVIGVGVAAIILITKLVLRGTGLQ